MIIEDKTALADEALENHHKYDGFMGISINHRFFSKKNIEKFVNWASPIFHHFMVLLMDDPEHYNFMIFKENEKEQALEKARTMGDQMSRGYMKVIRKNELDNVEVIRFKHIKEHRIFQTMLRKIWKHEQKNNKLREDLTNLMEQGIGGKIKRLEYTMSDEEIEEAKKTLYNYIVEELAAVVYLTEHGYPIEVDPTREFSTKKKLYEGEFPELAEDLEIRERGHIYAHPEGVEKSSY